jgi:hypothetical protein
MSKEFEEYERGCARIKGDNATLLAEFEQWLGQIDAHDLRELKDTIREEMPEWLEAVED